MKDLQKLNDEQFVEEFVKRFKCHGATIIYLDDDINNPQSLIEIGHGRYRNKRGKLWLENLIKRLERKELTIKELDI